MDPAVGTQIWDKAHALLQSAGALRP